MNQLLKLLLCHLLNIHDVKEEDWHDSYNSQEEYLGQVNFCPRCGQTITRKEPNQ